MAKLLSIWRAHTSHGNKISQVTDLWLLIIQLVLLLRLPGPNHKHIDWRPPSSISTMGDPRQHPQIRSQRLAWLLACLTPVNPVLISFSSSLSRRKSARLKWRLPVCIWSSCSLLPLAWSHNPLTTLTLICSLRGENSIRKHLNGLALLQPPQDSIVHHPFYCRVVWVFYWPCWDFVVLSRRAREEERDKEVIAAGSGNSQEKSLAEIATRAGLRVVRGGAI